MDFAWVVDALRRGLKVTRKIWAGEPLYIKMTALGSNSIIAVDDDTHVENWLCLNSDIFADDWEEYVEPKKDIQLRNVIGETIKITPEEMPLWPGVNADGYARMSKDSDVIVHDGVYRPHKKEPSAKYISLSDKETSLPNNPPYDYDMQDSNGGKPVGEPELEAETNKAIALVAKNIAENLAELLRNPSVQRILQKTGASLSNEDTNHV